jgi:3-phosphoshikimate 1-carboxyvinyltransferase
MNRTHRRVAPAGKPLRGRVSVPGDKSIAHRAILFNACARGVAVIRGLPHGADVASTIALVDALGCETQRSGPTTIGISGRGFRFAAPRVVLDCGNSGTTMRLAMGLLAAQSFDCVLDGDESLRRRPMERVARPLRAMGANVDTTQGRAPVRVRGGRLRPCMHELEVASAQVKTALLLAALQTEGRSEIREPIATRDHSERMLRAMGAEIGGEGGVSAITGPCRLDGTDVDVCGDASSAAFLVVAACLVRDSDLVIEYVGVNASRLGFVEVLRRMGADVTVTIEGESAGEPWGSLRVRASNLRGTTITAGEIPACIDELQVLAEAAAAATGTTTITGAAELRVKESDRIASTAAAIRAFGADVEERPDGLVVVGIGADRRFRGGASIESAGDHRIAMAGGVGALIAAGETSIDDAGAVAVSYPRFFDVLAEATT